MILEKQLKESSLPSERMWRDVYDQQVHENIDSNTSGDHGHTIQNENYFIAKVRLLNSQDFVPLPKRPTLKKNKKELEMESFVADKSFPHYQNCFMTITMKYIHILALQDASLNTLQSAEFDSCWL